MNMIEVKTAELSGSALDWAVAKAEGDEHWTSDRNIDWFAWRMRNWKPSTDWSQGGPLIEKYRAYPDRYHDTVVISEEGRFFVLADSETLNFGDEFDSMEGSTPLIAACRAIVAAKMGDVVQVPAELLENRHDSRRAITRAAAEIGRGWNDQD